MTSVSIRSSSVTLDNVDDYLAPSQACINPAFQPSSKLGAEEKKNSTTDEGKASSSTHAVVPRRRRRIVRKKILSSDSKPPGRSLLEDNSPSMVLPKSFPKSSEAEKKKIVKASMADCLACSGCVTTAETVMMEEKHSLKSLRKRLSSKERGDRSRVITLSPNSWADLSRYWNLDCRQKLPPYRGDEDKKEETLYECDVDDDMVQNFYLSRFTTLLSKILNVQIVVDGNIPLQWTWIGEAQEFCQVYKKNKEIETVAKRSRNPDNTPPPSVAIDASKTLYYKADGTSEIKENQSIPSPNLPLISGSCPALVCLVEKTLTKLVPHLSQGVSPMSMVGMILKDNDGDCNSNATRNWNWDHWAIMPCHDKKLEASRKDFAQSRDPKEQAVDLVITTKECVELVEEWMMSQHQQSNERTENEQNLCTNISVASYLASLPPSTICMEILEPSDFQFRIPYAPSKLPLLVTTPIIYPDDTFYSKTDATQKQMAFSSGGHANFLFQYAAKKLFGFSIENNKGVQRAEWKAASLASKNVRSARLGKLLKQHYYEAKLYRYIDGSYGTTEVQSQIESSEKSSTVVLHFAIAHGMQTMQRALKQVLQTPTHNQGIGNSCTLHYLEAMACPHGCVNGGGSAPSSSSLSTTNPDTKMFRTSPVRETPTETRKRVQSTLYHLNVPYVGNKKAWTAHFPRTGYHVVPQMNYKSGAVAGVNVENMIW